MVMSDEFAIPTSILRHFDLASIPYSQSIIEDTTSRRHSYPDGRLFFDQLLSIGEIDGPTLYPPTSPATLRRLLHAIYTSRIDRLKRDCFFYYLVKDYDASSGWLNVNGHNGNRETTMDVDFNVEAEEMDKSVKRSKRAETFVKSRCLPRTWRSLMDGYWALDHQQWDIAVSCLSDPSISELNFIPQFIHVLASHVSPPSRSLSLIRTFLTFTSYPLVTTQEIDIKLLALASAGSMSEAFTFIRSFIDPADRNRMREAVWCWALGSSRTPCGKGQQGAHPVVLTQLLHLPLSHEEHSHLLRFLSHPPRNIPGQALSALHDLVTLRLVHQGHYAESIELDKESAGVAGTDTDRQKRREMVREFIGILPQVQKRLLAIEGEERAGRREKERIGLVNGTMDDVIATTTDLDVDLGGSWAEVNGSTNQPTLSPGITNNTVPAPVPIRSSSSSFFDTAIGVPLPSSSVPSSFQHHQTQAQDSRPRSPFSGPPRFAMNRASPALIRQVLSGSPFALPRRTSSSIGSPVPKAPRKIINDDDDPIDGPVLQTRASRRRGRTSQSAAPPDTPHESTTGPEEHLPAEESGPRRSQRVVSAASQPQSDPSPPTSPPQRRTRGARPAPKEKEARDISLKSSTMPGAFHPEPLTESVPEDDVIQVGNPTPRRSIQETKGRGRKTRTASRAVLDEEDPAVTADVPVAKRTRRGGRDTSAAPSIPDDTPARGTGGGTGTGRTTRAGTRASTAQPSERGSPTPSIAASTRSEKTGKTTRRKGTKETIEVAPPSTRRTTRARRG